MADNCSALDSYFTSESGRIVDDIQSRLSGRSIMLDKVDRGPFPDGMGAIINVLTVERSFGSENDDAEWTAVTPSTGTGNAACLPDVDLMTFGQTLRQFQLKRTALESPDICLEDLRTEWMISQQLGKAVDSLTAGIHWKMELRAMNDYMANVGTSVVVNSALTETTNGVFSTATAPTSPLTQGVLDNYYLNITRESFGDGAVGRSGAAFVLGLVCSPETSRSLIRQNADIRQDINYAFTGDKMASELLLPYGVDRSYGNFAHVINMQMPRYDLVNNVLVRRNYFVKTSTTKGFKWTLNPLYTAAAYEVSLIWNPKVYKMLVPGNLNSPGGGTSFTTPDYFPVNMKWRNIPHRECNPDGTIGFFRAVMAWGAEPLHPEYGVAFLHLRCAPPLGLVACGS